MAFVYRARSVQSVDKRANQQGGEFQGFIKDEFTTYGIKKGSNWVRILPPTEPDADHYGIDIWVHFSIGPDKASALCPAKMANQHCPICEARAKFERMGAEDEARELKPSRRVLTWILDRNDEDKGPMLWAAAWTVDRDICKIAKDPRTGEVYLIDHPDQGYDVYFDKTGEGIGTKYTGFQIARKPSSVQDKHLDFIQKHPLWDALLIRDYDELKALYEGPGHGDAQQPEPRQRPSEDEPGARRRPEPEPEPRRRPVDDEPAPRRRPPEDDEASLRRDAEHIRGGADREADAPEQRRRPDDEPTQRPSEPEPRGGREEPRESSPSGVDRAAALRARFAKKS